MKLAAFVVPEPRKNRRQMAPWSRLMLGKLIFPKIVKKRPAFYGSSVFITIFMTVARQLSLASSPYPPILFFKMSYSIMLPSTPRSSEGSVSFMSLQKPCMYLSSPQYMSHKPFYPLLFDYRNTIWRVMLSTVRNIFPVPWKFLFRGPQYPPQETFSKSLIPYWRQKFLDQMVAGFPWAQYAVSFFMHAVLIFSVIPKYVSIIE